MRGAAVSGYRLAHSPAQFEWATLAVWGSSTRIPRRRPGAANTSPSTTTRASTNWKRKRRASARLRCAWLHDIGVARVAAGEVASMRIVRSLIDWALGPQERRGNLTAGAE